MNDCIIFSLKIINIRRMFLNRFEEMTRQIGEQEHRLELGLGTLVNATRTSMGACHTSPR